MLNIKNIIISLGLITTTQVLGAPKNTAYCPSVKEIKSICTQTKQPYQKSILPFSSCLILKVGQTHNFKTQETWKLTGVTSSMSGPIKFTNAHLNSNGTHCMYEGTQLGHYVYFSLNDKSKLTPDFSAPKNKWQQHIHKQDKKSQGNYPTCKAIKGDVTNCPFLVISRLKK